MGARPVLPPAIGRADLVRTGLDAEEADHGLGDWFGYGYRPVEPPTPAAETAGGSLHGQIRRLEHLAENLKEVAPPPATLCLRCITTGTGTPEDDAPQPAGTTAWVNRPARPPRFFPLCSGHRLKRMLEPLLERTVELGSPNIRRVVATLSRARALTTIPRREKSLVTDTLQCVVDRSSRLTPFWHDQAMAVAHVRRLFPHLALLTWVYEEAAGTLSPIDEATPEAPEPGRGPLLVLGDLGMFAAAGEVNGFWRDLARRFVFDGGSAAALVPCAPDEASPGGIGPWDLHPWEADVWLPATDADVERLLTLASAAVRLDPGLLRALRKELAPGVSPAVEIAVWQHQAIASRSVEAASFDDSLRAAYQRRLAAIATREPEVVAMTLGLIREWRHAMSDEIWYEEILGLPQTIREDQRFVDPQDVASANAFFAALRSGARQGALEAGQEAWLARVGWRQPRDGDGLWRNPYAAAAMRAVLASDPDFVPPPPPPSEPRPEDWHANVAYDGEGGIWLSEGELKGQPLGTLPMRGRIFSVQKNPSSEFAIRSWQGIRGQTRVEKLPGRFWIVSDRGRMEIGGVGREDLGWASAVSSDAIGPWAELRLGEAVLRFRWIPPGRGVIGPGPEDEQARRLDFERSESARHATDSTDQAEVIFSRGFWLLDRPVWVTDEVELARRNNVAAGTQVAEMRLTLFEVERVLEGIRKQTGAPVRLPSTVEWEYACRARVLGETTFAGTPDLSDPRDKTLARIAWFRPTADLMDVGRDLRELSEPMPLGRKDANPWGLHDMLGNVAEFCVSDAATDDAIPVMGGSFRHFPEAIRCGRIDWVSPDAVEDWIGFRPAIGESEIESLRPLNPPRRTIVRNRVPRVHLSYEVEAAGRSTQVELPFVIGVMADLAGDAERADVHDRLFIDIDADRFDAVMAAIAPRLRMRVPNRVSEDGGDLGVELTFASMDDFRPDRIARAVPELVGLSDARERVAALLKAPKESPGAARQNALDVFRTLANFFPALASRLAEESPRALEIAVSELDRRLSLQLNEILRAPQMRALEGTWRGLHYLVGNTETDQTLKIRVLDLAKNELASGVSGPDGDTLLFNAKIHEPFAQFGGEPFGTLIGAYEFDHRREDKLTLERLSASCAAAHAPFIAAAAPSLLGVESWRELEPMPSTTAESVYWKSLREGEDARYLALTVPRVLARLPWGATTEPVEGLAFEEEARGDDEDYVWMNAAFAMGVNIGRSFKRFGWVSDVRGVEGGGMVEGLPVHVFATDDVAVSARGPVSAEIDDRLAVELSERGLMPLVHRRNSDAAAFLSAQSLFEPPAAEKHTDPEAQANERLSASLPYLFAASRFAQYLKAIARDRIGRFRDSADLEQQLTEWLGDYVLPNPESASEAERAKRPLAGAELRIGEMEGPDGFPAQLLLRPHYRFEDRDATLRLSLRLPAVRS